MNREEIVQALKIQRRIHGKLAQRKLEHFATYTNPKIKNEWFHRAVYSVLDDWITGKRKKVAVFMPPQHGKSTMSSVMTPAKILGQIPTAGIAVASYSDTHASKFNRECQDIIDSKDFREIYPGVVLPGKGIETTNELRNNTYFEIVKHKGFFKAVSIGGSLTGTPVDFGIIDDPIKDRKQANSKTYRDNLWDWYNDVFKTRLHNDSRQLMLFTRWHEDDLAGRLFNPKNEHFDQEELNEWDVICLPALKESKNPMANAMDLGDPRSIDEALWPEKHSAEKHIKTRRINPTTHASLNQQRPSPAKGNKIKKEWFRTIGPEELPFNPDHVAKEFWIDGAFTDKTENDESATLVCSKYNGNLYVFNCHGVRKELHEFLEYIRPFFRSMGYSGRSTVNIEMKASGYGFYSMLKSPKYGSHNCVKINSKVVSYGKMNRVENIQPTLASGKVFLVRGPWIDEFLEQLAVFPNGTHDDMVDVLAYAIHEHFIQDSEVFVAYS
jgi:predicted phage terminase large subunit-like protein